MRDFDIKGNGDKKKHYDGVTKNKPITSDWAYNSPSNKRMNRMVTSLKKPLATDTEGKNLKKNIIKAGAQEAIGGAISKDGRFTRNAKIADNMVGDLNKQEERDGFNMYTSKMKTHYMKEGMKWREKADSAYNANFNKYIDDTTYTLKPPKSRSDY